MTKRVVINQNTFKVLKKTASVDADVAPYDDLAFDGFALPYAAVLWSGVENTGSFPSQLVDPFPWIPSLAENYEFKTSTRWIKTINSKIDKNIDQRFSAPPAVIWMARYPNASEATPSFSFIQQTNWPGSTAENWSGAAVWCSTALDSNGYVNLTIRLDRSDFATSAPTAMDVSYVVFQNFTGLPGLTE